MDLSEILKAHGVADDVIDKISAAMKENKIYTTGEENLDIRYGKLKTQHDGVVSQLDAANKLIEDLKKAGKGNEDLQGRITGYESQVAQLQAELEATKVEAAIKVALLSEKALDVDYLTYKLKEKGQLELDENGNIKGIDDKIAGLKVQFPTQFESAAGAKKIEEHRLEGGNDDNHALTRSDILKKPYAERVAIYNENPEAYNEAMKG